MWRKHADAQNWQKITLDGLTLEDTKQLIQILENIVPVVSSGYAADTLQRFSRSHECKDNTESEAAELLYYLKTFHLPYLGELQPFHEIEMAKDKAIQILHMYGIKYCGMHTTYISRDAKGRIVTIQPKSSEEIENRKYSELLSLDPPNGFSAWLQEFPNEKALELDTAWRLGIFGKLSPVDHALNILNAAKWLEVNEEELKQTKLWRCFYAIGEHMEALRLEPVVLEAHEARLQADTRRKNGRLGGLANKKMRAYEVLNNLASIQKEKFTFASDSQAIRLARQIAAQYDREHDENLFKRSGSLYRASWFEEWLLQFREKMSKQLK